MKGKEHMNTTLQSKMAERMPEISHLDADSRRSIRAIFQNGYYETHQTLGVGGWPVVYQFASDWKTYVLHAVGNTHNEFEDTIIAKDDQTAIKAFSDKYYLENCTFSICEKTTTYREIA